MLKQQGSEFQPGTVSEMWASPTSLRESVQLSDPEIMPSTRYLERQDRDSQKPYTIRRTPPLSSYDRIRQLSERSPSLAHDTFIHPTTPVAAKRSISNSYSRVQHQHTAFSMASTVDTAIDPFRDPLSKGKEFVPSQHLSLDAFPQFPSIRQTPSAPPLRPDHSNIEEEAVSLETVPTSTDSYAEHATLFDVSVKLFLLVRAILKGYQYFWYSLVVVVISIPLFVRVARHAMTALVIFFVLSFLWNIVKTMFTVLCSPVPSLLGPEVPMVAPSPPKQRLRDLPEHQPSLPPPLVSHLTDSKAVREIPHWLRWCPIGTFGEADVTRPTLKASPAMVQVPFPQGSRRSERWSPHDDGDRVDVTHKVVRQLKMFIAEHPLVAFYSLNLNDNAVVNLSDRHLPATLVNLCTSLLQQDRQKGEQLIQLLVHRRQSEKYFMAIPTGQRVVYLRRLARWLYRGLEKEYSVHCPALTNPTMTDGDLLHHLLFTWLAQQLPILKTDVFSRTHLAVQPIQETVPPLWGHRSTVLASILSIQKLPTEVPSSPGTIYRITELIPSSTKPKVIEVSWDGFGVIEGIAQFLIRLKSSRPDIISQGGSELVRILES